MQSYWLDPSKSPDDSWKTTKNYFHTSYPNWYEVYDDTPIGGMLIRCIIATPDDVSNEGIHFNFNGRKSAFILDTTD
jgi:hypothetical protein